jgi:hypothetical protein
LPIDARVKEKATGVKQALAAWKFSSSNKKEYAAFIISRFAHTSILRLGAHHAVSKYYSL